jgi:uncharacterized BrkB/YihY/UPF0761 family membrane protein
VTVVLVLVAALVSLSIVLTGPSPLIALVVSQVIAFLHWVTPGGLVAYGSLAAVIVFLIWLWITNVVVLLGAEVNAEIERGRQIEQGHPAEQEPFLPPRDEP